MIHLKKIEFNTLFLRLLFTYILFLVIPVIFFSMLFKYNFTAYMEEQISISNLSKLSMVRTNMETMIEGLARDALKVSTSESIQELGNIDLSSKIQSSENIYRIKGAYESLNQLAKTNTNIHSVYLYSDYLQYVFSSQGETFTLSDFKNHDWINKYKSNRNKTFIYSTVFPVTSDFIGRNSSQLSGTKDTVKVITLLYPLSTYSFGTQGVIAINIYEESLKKYLSLSNYGEPNSIYIIDSSGSLITGTDNTKFITNDISKQYISRILETDEAQAFFTDNNDSVMDMITYTKSNVNDCIYIDITPVNELFKIVWGMRIILFAASVSLLFAGIILSYLFSRKMCKPVKVIMDVLKSKAYIDVSGNQNELFVLKGVVNKFIKDEEQFREIIKQNNEDLNYSYLVGLLNGKVDAGKCSSLFKKTAFFCLLLSIDNYQEFISCHTNEEQGYLKYIILKVCEEVLNIHAAGNAVLIEPDKICMLVNSDKLSQTQFKELAFNIFSYTKQEVYGVEHISISCGAGNAYEGEEGIRESYHDAAEAIKYRIVYGHGSFICYSDISNKSKEYYFPIRKAKYIINHISLNSFDGVRQTVEEIINELRRYNDISYDNLKNVFYQLITDAVNYILICNLKLGDIFEDSNAIYRAFDMKETLDDIKTWLLEFYNKIIKYKGKSENTDKKYIAEIVQLIGKTYMRSDLDINYIAHKMDLSYSHLRRIFKENIEDSFVDYVNNLRITEAKRLLLNTELTTEQVASSVGFNNFQSFCRVFKKMEGITPGKYRNIGREKASQGFTS